MTEPRAPAGAQDRLESALAELGAEHEPPPGWEARVLAATTGRRRWWWIVTPIAGFAALAVVVVLWLYPAGGALALDVAVEGGPRVRASAGTADERSEAMGGGGPQLDGSRNTAHVGQVVRVAASGGGRYRAVWIYREGALVVACPAAAACRGPDRAELRVTAIGNYTIVGLASDAPLPGPAGAFDTDVAEAITAGARWTRAELSVR